MKSKIGFQFSFHRIRRLYMPSIESMSHGAVTSSISYNFILASPYLRVRFEDFCSLR